MLHNWGGKQGMYGRMQRVANDLPKALADPAAGRLVGLGATMEGFEVNPIVFDQLFEMAWHTQPIDLDEWVRAYVRRRYGADNPDAQAAWKILLDQLYSCRDKRHGPQGSFLAMRPTLNSKGRTFSRAGIFYDTKKVQEAFRLLLNAGAELGDQDTYRYDLVDLGRQVMSDLSQKQLHPELRAAHGAKDRARFESAANRWLEALRDTDRLLQTHRMFQLGRWLDGARTKGTTEEEQALYEINARNIITLWGGKNSPLSGYAQRQYGGLMGDFYHARWKMFFDMALEALAKEKGLDAKAFENRVRAYEEAWTREQNPYPAGAVGDTLEAARILADKYCP